MPQWLHFTLSGLAVLSTTGVVMAVDAGAAHAATPTLPATTPLAFEAADGNMACDGTGGGAGCTGATPNYLDWNSSYVTGSSAFQNVPDTDPQCTGGRDEIFSQGTKENDTTVTVACSPSPPKVNLTQMYAWHQTVGTDTYLYLAWEAPNQSGSNNNHIDFELNQVAQSSPPSGGGTWQLTRTPGDILIDFDITPTVPFVCYSTWSGSAWVFPTGGTANANCASNEAALNTAIAAVAGAGFTDPNNATSIPVGGFGEMGIDLNMAGLFSAGQCANFANIWVKSRSSGSGQTSELKSFIAPPHGISVNNCSSTTGTTPNDSFIALGGSNTDSATVTGIGSTAAPTGTVTFFWCGPTATTCTSGGTQFDSEDLKNATVNGSAATISSSAFTPSAAGTYCFRAVYSGDSNYPSSSDGSSGECFRVDAIDTTLSSSSISAGGTAHDSATLSGVTGTAGGHVTYTVYTDSTCTTAATTGAGNDIDAQPAQVTVTNGSVPNSADVTFNNANTYYWQASYTGDTSNAAVKSPCTSEQLNVGVNPTTTTTGLSATAITVGDTAHDTATVTGATNDAGDTVTYTVYSTSDCLTAATTGAQGQIDAQPASVQVQAGGAVPNSDTVTFQQPGTYYWQAHFEGDGNNAGSFSACGSEIINVDAISTLLSASSTAVGNSVNDSATLAGATANADGTVTYTVYSESTCTTAATTGANGQIDAQPAPVTVSAGAVPDSASVTFNDTGTYYWQASYDGGTNDAATKSPCTSEQLAVTPLNPGIVTTPSGPVTLPNASISDSAQLSGFHSPLTQDGTAAGTADTVTFKLYGPSSAASCVTAINTQTVNIDSSGAASTAAVPVTAAGNYWWTATYNGDLNNNTADSRCGVEESVVRSSPPPPPPPPPVTNPILTASKTSTPAPGSTVSLGQTVTYGLSLANAGNAVASAVTMTDTVPAGTTYVPGSASCGSITACVASFAAGVVTWTGIDVPAMSGSTPGTAGPLTFEVTVNSDDTNGQVIPNFGIFTNENTPSCTGSSCPTNTVQLTVAIPATTPGTPPTTTTTAAPIVGATTVHTGKPWAGSRLIELIVAAIGFGLIGFGERQRRRQRRATVELDG